MAELTIPASDWMSSGACLGMDPELFFPSRGESTREARDACRACPVAAECLERALAVPEMFGMWGGKSERERKRLRRQRELAERRRLIGGAA